MLTTLDGVCTRCARKCNEALYLGCCCQEALCHSKKALLLSWTGFDNGGGERTRIKEKSVTGLCRFIEPHHRHHGALRTRVRGQALGVRQLLACVGVRGFHARE